MVEKSGECHALAALFAEKSKTDGLEDVKFFVAAVSEFSAEEICGEVNRLYEAVAAGRVETLNFGDLAWQSA